MPVVTFRVSLATLAAVDAMRGTNSRETWLNKAVRQVVEDGLRPRNRSQQADDDEEDG